MLSGPQLCGRGVMLREIQHDWSQQLGLRLGMRDSPSESSDLALLDRLAYASVLQAASFGSINTGQGG